MYQQHLKDEKSTSVTDFLLVVIFLLLAIFMRQIVDFCAALPAPWRSLSQLMLFILFVGICLFIYKRRICSYRYTVIFEAAPEGELDQYGNQLVWPWPIGTVLFERMVANKGKIAEEIAPNELIALVKPEANTIGVIAPEGVMQKPNFLNTARLTRFSRKTASMLVFARNGKTGYIYFHPDDTLSGHIEALLRAKCEAQAGEDAGQAHA